MHLRHTAHGLSFRLPTGFRTPAGPERPGVDASRKGPTRVPGDGIAHSHGRARAGLLGLLLLASCGSGDAPPDATAGAAGAEAPLVTPSEEVSRGFGDVEVELLDTRWTGDLDGMIERRIVRALVVPTQTHYFVHNGKAQGIAAEMLLAFEKFLNRNHAPEERHLRTHVVFVPTTRDDLIPALNEGRGDLAVAALTITPGRLARADFSEPFLADVDEIIVTGPAGPELERLEDLAGTEIHVRASSSYHEHLEALNERFREAGLEPIRLVKVPEVLQDADLMELVDAGVLGPIVVDDYKAELWAKVFPNLVLRHDLAVNTGGEFGWMMRKGSPKLKAQVDAFARRHRQGTLFGNTVLKRYTESTRYVRDALSSDARLRFDAVDELFRRYAERYGLDYLLSLAQGFQESRLDHEVRSPVGAIGIMQLMPTTAEAIGIEGVGDLEANIHAGIKYTRNLIDRYFDDPGIDRLNRELFALAAYNAGPTRIRRLRREAEAQGFDPDVWFDNVEVVAARSIGRETVDYVANIYKTYYAYRLLAKNEAERKRAREALDDRA